jgi:hypothetical protein
MMKLRVLTFVLAIAVVSTTASAQTAEPQPATQPELQADTQVQADSELSPETPPPIAGPRLQVLASTPQDSPLVAAAKRAKAQQKTHVVITNATIKKHSGKAHFTTTRHQPPLKDIPPSEVAKIQPVAAAKPKPQAAQPAQSEQPDPTDPYDDELADLTDRVKCPSCLPILDPIPVHLSLTKAEVAHAGPQVVPPLQPPVSETEKPEPPPPEK